MRSLWMLVSAFFFSLMAAFTKLGAKEFGTFEVKKKMERIVVNPVTRQRLLVPPKLSLTFKPCPALKGKVKNEDAQ